MSPDCIILSLTLLRIGKDDLRLSPKRQPRGQETGKVGGKQKGTFGFKRQF